MSEYFENDKDKEILVQWRGQHELKMHLFHDELVQGLHRKLHNVIEQKKASQEFEERKATFEKNLLQKSKELANQMKDKTQNDEELNKQFNHVWEGWVSELTQGITPVEEINLTDDLIEAICELGFEKNLITSRINTKDYKDIAVCGDYTIYVIQKAEDDKAKSGRISNEYQKQIKNVITTSKKEATDQLKSKPLEVRGYSPTYLSEMSRNVKASIDQFISQWKYLLLKEFQVDLILYVFGLTEKWIKDSHSESMTEAVINQTAIDVAGELKCNVPAFNGNRLNLEKHVLKSLAEKKEFKRYKTYINNPRSYTETFIMEETKTLLDTVYKEKCQCTLNRNILNIKTHLLQALHDATEKTKAENGDIAKWLQEFIGSVKDKLIFGTISCENFIDVSDLNFFHDEIKKGVKTICADLEHVSVDKLLESRQSQTRS
ncbi:hypothetical protein WMY93_032399 [Mugilogobius chulae]|uniref:Interferon-induced very large GTPase 1 domain-containing protein n=1 Tax=Mugilogobius chulae TaxID=88201 RepID=A0AAW0MUS4_9GOBI